MVRMMKRYLWLFFILIFMASSSWAAQQAIDPDTDTRYRTRWTKENANDTELYKLAHDSYSSLQEYDDGDVVTSNHVLYVSLQDNNTGHPVTDPAWWQEMQTGGGAVDSVFGRTGVVTAQAGDYSAYYLALATCSTIGEVPTWNGSAFVCSTPTGSGDMAKATYDTGDNGIVDNAEALLGGTWAAPGAIGSTTPTTVTGTTATFDMYNTSAADGERYQLIWNTNDPSTTCDTDHNGAFAYRRSDNSFRYCDGTAWSPWPGGDGSGNVILTEGATAPTAGSLPEGSLFHDTTDHTLYLQTATGLLHSGAWSWEANPAPTYTLDLTISGALSGDSITVDGTAYTASATISGLADGVQTLTQAFGGTNDTVTWSGTDAGLVTGTPPNTQIDMGGANRSLTATFGVATACSNIWAEVASSNDYWGYTAVMAQKIKVTTAIDICETDIEMYRVDNGGTGPVVHLEIWDTVDESGTQIGVDSDQVTITATAAGAMYEFPWSTDPHVTADAHIHIVIDSDGGGDSLYLMSNDDPTSYETTDYDFWRSTSADIDQDLHFKVITK